MSAWDSLTEQAAAEETDVLDEVEAFLGRFVAFPNEHTRVAVTLWAVHAHALDAFESSPRLAALSPEPGSGKTRLLEVLELLVPRPMFTVNASSAALFRKVADPDGRPTLLLDEADTVFGPRSAKDHEDLRGFVNAGHRRGAVATRCAVYGKTVIVEDFPAYAAVALAGLDDLPETIMSRSVVVRMRRRAPDERVEPFRHRLHAATGHDLRERLTEWAAQHVDALSTLWPDLPDGITDRPADVWEPLVAVADLVGGTWPDRSRVAAVALVADSQGGAESLGVKLLRDLFDIFSDTDRLPTEDILTALHTLDESPWGDLRGKPLDARGLSRRLSKYGIKPHSIRVDDRTPKGYERVDFSDAWTRYLPPTVADVSDVSVREIGPYSQESNKEGKGDHPSLFPQESATSATSATDCPHGMADGDKPDPFVNGRLSCPECRAALAS